MCGIFGFTVKKYSRPDQIELHQAFDELVRLSESRGKEAAGVALLRDKEIAVLKENVRGTKFIQDDWYKDLIETPFQAIIGHTRLVTNGSMEDHENNQPVVRNGLVGIHNGIIVNDREIFERFNLERKTEVDTEALLALIQWFGFTEVGLKRAMGEIEGEASVAIFSAHAKSLVLATNNGSLYRAKYKYGEIFASERYILESLPESLKVEGIRKLTPGTIEIINFESEDLKINDVFVPRENRRPVSPAPLDPGLVQKFAKMYEFDSRAIADLKRCSKCILPETMPFIEFDKEGICNYCRNYKKKVLKSKGELEDIAKQIREQGKDPDCLFPLSGGRDSSYGLHYVKESLGLNPIAYSYDWGMLTDLGRRNQARMSGKLGVEHLWLSADIIKKRENIRKNVLAWLKKPDLGTVPLFMAGDKQYFYYLNKLRKQLGLQTVFYCENDLEKTHFKFGFCGIAPRFNIGHAYHLGILNKLKLGWYYFKQVISHPSYLNTSLLDSIGAFISSYFISHDYIFLYDYISWDEKEIEKTLIKDYNWETSSETPTTWRIGDGTAAFYNYIYFLGAGFTENDTFRSNQIREGLLKREDALELAKAENRPRYESINWYCNTIGIDFGSTLEAIHRLKPRY